MRSTLQVGSTRVYPCKQALTTIAAVDGKITVANPTESCDGPVILTGIDLLLKRTLTSGKETTVVSSKAIPCAPPNGPSCTIAQSTDFPVTKGSGYYTVAAIPIAANGRPIPENEVGEISQTRSVRARRNGFIRRLRARGFRDGSSPDQDGSDQVRLVFRCS